MSRLRTGEETLIGQLERRDHRKREERKSRKRIADCGEGALCGDEASESRGRKVGRFHMHVRVDECGQAVESVLCFGEVNSDRDFQLRDIDGKSQVKLVKTQK